MVDSPTRLDFNAGTRNAHAGRVGRRFFIRSVFRTSVVGVALSILAGGLAACGNDVGATGPGDEPIVIGNVGTTSGPLGDRYGVMQKAVQAWADAVNKNGGIAGRPIRVEVADDANEPAKHLSLVQEMVERKKVVAFVGVPSTNTQGASVEYLEEKGIPVVGGIVGEPPWGTSPILFPHAISAKDKARVLLYTAASSGKTKYAFIGINTHGHGHAGQPSIDEFVEGFRAGGAAEVGMELAFEAELEPDAPDSDYAEVCLGAKRAGAELMTILTDFNTQKKVIASCARQQFTPTYVTTGTTTDQKIVDLAGEYMEGAIGLSRTAPWMADEPTDLNVWRKAMEANNLPANATSLQGWVSGRILEVAVRQHIDDEITPATIADALRGLDGANLQGLVAPLNFGSSPTEPNPGSKCFWLLVVKNGKWAPSEEGRMCLP